MLLVVINTESSHELQFCLFKLSFLLINTMETRPRKVTQHVLDLKVCGGILASALHLTHLLSLTQFLKTDQEACELSPVLTYHLSKIFFQDPEI